eukprot:TRINITY_DN62162_c0_g1_i1.p1 TRINITY_DN62162_c0_g1~~TRINITY_DN62162_c0_g1_i1.p1  ORF type:complete len:654 (+),score=153.84 TRINITY_DN62162_c0_g1_i1:74-2035(+)
MKAARCLLRVPGKLGAVSPQVLTRGAATKLAAPPKSEKTVSVAAASSDLPASVDVPPAGTTVSSVAAAAENSASSKPSSGGSGGGGGGFVRVAAVLAVGAGAGAYAFQDSLPFPVPGLSFMSRVLPGSNDSTKEARQTEANSAPVVDKVILSPEALAAKAAEEAAAAAAAKEAAAQAAAVANATKAASEAASVVAKNAAIRSLEEAEGERMSAERLREDAVRSLRDALASKDPQAISEALDTARRSSVGDCAESILAESIVEPGRFLRNTPDYDQLGEILLLHDSLRGLTSLAAAAAEREACASLTVEQLRFRVGELSRHLAANRLYAKPRIEASLMTRLDAADVMSLKHLEEALERLAKSRAASDKEELISLQQQLQEDHDEQVARASAEATSEMQRVLEEEERRLSAEIEAKILHEQGSRLVDVALTNSGLMSVETALTQDAAIVQRIQAQSSLAVAVLSVEDAILSGHDARAELEALRAVASRADEFSNRMLEGLPEGCWSICEGASSMLGLGLLRQRLASETRELVAAAFVPPATPGTRSSLLAELIGQFCGKLYSCESSAAKSEAFDAATEVQRNLDALAYVAASHRASEEPVSQLAELTAVLIEMESSLVGVCRERASRLLEEMRHVLLLQQVLMAIKARVHCLSLS